MPLAKPAGHFNSRTQHTHPRTERCCRECVQPTAFLTWQRASGRAAQRTASESTAESTVGGAEAVTATRLGEQNTYNIYSLVPGPCTYTG